MLELKIRIRGSELNQTDPFRCDASVENIAAGNYGPRHATTLKFFRSCILYTKKDRNATNMRPGHAGCCAIARGDVQSLSSWLVDPCQSKRADTLPRREVSHDR